MTSPVSYTPGHTDNATDFMARRSLTSHGEFFQEHLSPDLSVLDCGCGPGSITMDIAKRVVPGCVVGVDAEASEVERVTADAEALGLRNASFQTADAILCPLKTALSTASSATL